LALFFVIECEHHALPLFVIERSQKRVRGFHDFGGRGLCRGGAQRKRSQD
jgi:hypothetical protein